MSSPESQVDQLRSRTGLLDPQIDDLSSDVQRWRQRHAQEVKRRLPLEREVKAPMKAIRRFNTELILARKKLERRQTGRRTTSPPCSSRKSRRKGLFRLMGTIVEAAEDETETEVPTALITPPAEPADHTMATLIDSCGNPPDLIVSARAAVCPLVSPPAGKGPTAEETATALIIQSFAQGRVKLHPSVPPPVGRPPIPLVAASAALEAAVLAEPSIPPPLVCAASTVNVARLLEFVQPLLAVTAAQQTLVASHEIAQEEYEALKGVDVLPCALHFLTIDGCPFGSACPLPHACADGRLSLTLEQRMALLFRLSDQLPDIVAVLNPTTRSPINTPSPNRSPSVAPPSTEEVIGSSASAPFIAVTSSPSSDPSGPPASPPARPRAPSLEARVRPPSVSLPSLAAMLAGSTDQISFTIPASPAAPIRYRSTPPPRLSVGPSTEHPRRRSRRSKPTPPPAAINTSCPPRLSQRQPHTFPAAPGFHSASNPAFGYPTVYPPAQLHYHPYAHPTADELSTMPAPAYEAMYRPQQMFSVYSGPAAPPPPGMVWQTWQPGTHGFLLPMPPSRPPSAHAGRPRRVSWSDEYAAAEARPSSSSVEASAPAVISGQTAQTSSTNFVAG